MKIIDIEPTTGHLLVQIPEKQKEVNGLILAGEQANNAPVRGSIIRVPQGGSLQFKLGEEIFFRKYAIDELKFTNDEAVEETVFIIDEREVLGVVRPIEVPEKEETTQDLRATSKDGDAALRDAVGGKNKRPI